MNIQASALKKSIDNLRALEKELKSMPIHEAPTIAQLLKQYDEKYKVENSLVACITYGSMFCGIRNDNECIILDIRGNRDHNRRIQKTK